MRTAVQRAGRETVSRSKVKAFRPGTTSYIASDLDPMGTGVPDRVWGVRLLQKRESPGLISGRELLITTNTYLDGRVVTTSAGQTTITEVEQMAPTALPGVRTKDILDFGRMQTAASELVRQIQQVGADPSKEQLEILLLSYQGILEWRRRAREQMQNAEGQIDTVGQMLKGLLQ